MEKDESLSEQRIKHLEFIQAIVNRLGTNSFLIKGWAITVTAAIFAFEAKDPNWRMALTTFLPVVAFWLLDSYFLRQERLFRRLYDDVRRKDSSTEPFSMDVRPYQRAVRLSAVVRSRTMVIFYGVLFVLAVVFFLVSLLHTGSAA
ncbi:hypothetical protein [Micromonospora mirobrigensis]|uniref:Uncharacterized protein n=1 Tax=Micromonospora mirobrigensis TaxID=262898 RepID=A0A1C4X499_9ACTN|nr:hypothetical protein [Micromonospora mirobrigensis]SCF03276.1 hypothetical protein GA0070564_102704 [Micromonospora mirobrigensis]